MNMFVAQLMTNPFGYMISVAFLDVILLPV